MLTIYYVYIANSVLQSKKRALIEGGDENSEVLRETKRNKGRIADDDGDSDAMSDMTPLPDSDNMDVDIENPAEKPLAAGIYIPAKTDSEGEQMRRSSRKRAADQTDKHVKASSIRLQKLSISKASSTKPTKARKTQKSLKQRGKDVADRSSILIKRPLAPKSVYNLSRLQVEKQNSKATAAEGELTLNAWVAAPTKDGMGIKWSVYQPSLTKYVVLGNEVSAVETLNAESQKLPPNTDHTSTPLGSVDWCPVRVFTRKKWESMTFLEQQQCFSKHTIHVLGTEDVMLLFLWGSKTGHVKKSCQVFLTWMKHTTFMTCFSRMIQVLHLTIACGKQLWQIL